MTVSIVRPVHGKGEVVDGRVGYRQRGLLVYLDIVVLEVD